MKHIGAILVTLATVLVAFILAPKSWAENQVPIKGGTGVADRHQAAGQVAVQ